MKNQRNLKAELHDLAQTLECLPPSVAGGEIRRPRKHDAMPGRRRMYLGGSIVAIILAVASIVYAVINPPPDPAAEPVPEAAAKTPEQVSSIVTQSRSRESHFASRANLATFAPPEKIVDARTARARSIRILGKLPPFIPITAVHPRKDGKPFIVYVILRSPFDERAEQMWKVCGMFRNENDILTPYVRCVTIDDDEAMRKLLDSHVEFAIYSLDPKSMPTEPEAAPGDPAPPVAEKTSRIAEK